MAFNKERLTIEIDAKNLTASGFAGVANDINKIGKNTDAANAMLAKMGASFNFIKNLGVAGMFVAAAHSVIDFHKEIAKSVGDIADLADAIELSTDRYQAMAFASQKAGVSMDTMSTVWTKFKENIGKALEGNKETIESFDRLGVKILDANGKVRDTSTVLAEVATKLLKVDDEATKTAIAKELLGKAGGKLNGVLKELAGGLDLMTANAKKAGVVISEETIKIFDDMGDQADEAGMRIKKMYAEIAAPIHKGAIDAFNEALKDMQKFVSRVSFDWKDLLATFTLIGPIYVQLRNMGLFSPSSSSLTSGLESQLAQLKELRKGMVEGMDDIKGIDKQIADIEAKIKARSGGRGFGGPEPVQLPPLSVTAPPGVANPKPKSDGTDKAADAVARLNEEYKALTDAYAKMQSIGMDMPFKDATRAIEMEIKVSSQLNSMLKGVPEDDPRRKQITDMVRKVEEARLKLAEFKEALTLADQTERQFGDGSLELKERLESLKEAYDTGRLSIDAYREATKKAQEDATLQKLRFEGAQGGLRGLAAGFQFARESSERAFTTFEMGQRLYTDGLRALSDEVMHFAETGEFSFKRVALAWANMIFDMAAKKAMSGLGDILTNILGSVFTSLAGGVSGSAGSDIHIGGNAEGGRVTPSRMSAVGERGMEVWAPDRAGTVFNQEQLADALSGGGGRGDTYEMHWHLETGKSQTIRAELVAMMPHLEQRMIQRLVQERSRGGTVRNHFKR